MLRTNPGDVIQNKNCLVTSSILHLTSHLPDTWILVVPQDVLQIIIGNLNLT